MIRALQTRAEYQQSIKRLRAANLPLHFVKQKNWDHDLLRDLLADYSKDCPILDIGSGEGDTLDFLYRLGYRNLTGIDYVPPKLTWKQRLVRTLLPNRFYPESVITIGDVHETHLPDASFDVLACISVIEHGVDPVRFFTEAHRLLKPGGCLFITTDYWADAPNDFTSGTKIFGLEWNVFNRDRIEEIVRKAKECGLHLQSSEPAILDCQERIVDVMGFEYTFIAAIFVKS